MKTFGLLALTLAVCLPALAPAPAEAHGYGRGFSSFRSGGYGGYASFNYGAPLVFAPAYYAPPAILLPPPAVVLPAPAVVAPAYAAPAVVAPAYAAPVGFYSLPGPAEVIVGREAVYGRRHDHKGKADGKKK